MLKLSKIQYLTGYLTFIFVLKDLIFLRCLSLSFLIFCAFFISIVDPITIVNIQKITTDAVPC